MAKAADARAARKQAGLCADCVHTCRVESDRGSVFLFCELSRSDRQFAKYPPLPVLSCPGYEKTAEEAERT